MVLLAMRPLRPTAENQLEVTHSDLETGFRPGEEWHGLYRGDDKVGFVRIDRTLLPDGYRTDYHTVMQLTVLGQQRRIELDVITEADENLVLRSFSGSTEAEGAVFSARGTITPAADPTGMYHLEYIIDTAGTEQTGSVDLPEPPVVQSDVRRVLLDREPEVGERYETSYFDPLARAHRPVVLQYEGVDPLLVMNEPVEAHHMVQFVGDLALDVWINDIGEVLVEDMPLGMQARRESRAEAMYRVLRRDENAPEPADLIEASRIEVDGVPPNLDTVGSASWSIQGLNLDRFDIAGGRQTVSPGEGGVATLSLTRESAAPRVTVDAFDPPSEIRRFLAPTPLVQSDAGPILERAALIRGQRTQVEDIARATHEWVAFSMTQEMVVGVPSALEILQNLRGDCNEHATLTTALLRANGVPARIASGIAFLDGAFYFHAWVEYWNGDWRTIDPTWGQAPADLGHIRLVAGGLDRQIALTELFGRLVVEPLTTEPQ